ncbi:MAG: hypothetical protein K2K63_16360 [Acetatifactor sp.]|nr:hypothetical protein [Acetatifactor sp.]
MSSHQASEQMLGYLYQVRYALALLLNHDNPDFQISMEKFDDIAFSKDDVPKQLIQVKHHVQHHGNLSDASTDLWRTLKVWIDIINTSPDILDGTEFLIITTSIAPKDSAAYCLKKDDNRNTDGAYQLLKEVCEKSENKAHTTYYNAFLKMDEKILKRLIEQICIIDGASNIIDVDKVFRKQIRYSCIPKYENHICERLEGWWYRKAIEALCSDNPIFITQNQIRALIVSMSQEYSDENLPIDIFEFGSFQENDLGDDEKIFYKQLELIHLGSRRMQVALRDYYRAFHQRANWVRNDLLFINELELYEQRLIDEWDHRFAEMEDNLNEYGSADEEEKIKEGRTLFLKLKI